MAGFEVIFYEKENGDCPVEEFIDSLDVKMRAKMVGLLELLEEKGNQLREPYSKLIDDGIFEIRCKVGNNITRVIYFFYYEGKIILTNGFVKSHKRLHQRKSSWRKYVEQILRKGWENHEDIKTV